MAKELNEETGFNISVKTLIGIGFAMATIISMWFVLQADIAEAKELPKPEISKMEFNMKDVNIRQSIKNTEKNVEKLEERMIRMEDKIDALR
jgi:ribosomal protein S13|tara:strand:+ start:2187 stop:2462 length:276 start_codon:yes stop_codon:yes gene_type:complete